MRPSSPSAQPPAYTRSQNHHGVPSTLGRDGSIDYPQSESSSHHLFDETVRNEQKSSRHRNQSLKARLEAASITYMLAPARVLPKKVRDFNFLGLSLGHIANALASPVTVNSIPFVAPFLAVNQRSKALFDFSAIQGDAFAAVGIVSSENDSRDIRRALRKIGILTPDNCVASRINLATFSSMTESSLIFSSLGLSESQTAAIGRYLEVTANMVGEPVPPLEELSRQDRKAYLALRKVTWTDYSPGLMKRFVKAGILDKDFLPKDSAKLTAQFFSRNFSETSFYLTRQGPILRTFLGDSGDPVPPHEALRQLLFGMAPPLPPYPGVPPPPYEPF